MNDAEIVDRVLSGDQAPFRELVARYKDFVFRVAYAVTRRSADADDILQQAFLSAYQALPELKDRDNVRGWLYSITYHLAQDWLRRHIRSRQVEKPLEQAAERAAEPPPTEGEPQMKERVLSGLNELPESHRQIILLKYVDGLSYKDIARTLQISESAVGERLWRARQHFERVLVTLGMGPQALA